jgi:hypothetical protein
LQIYSATFIQQKFTKIQKNSDANKAGKNMHRYEILGNLGEF